MKEKRARTKKLRTPQQQKKRRRIALCSMALVLALLCYFCFGVLKIQSWRGLSVSKLTDLAQTLLIYDANGDAVASVYGAQDRIMVDIDTIPQEVRNAFIAAEDVRFYKHHGVDVKRIFGAMLTNIQKGGYSEGASTITQQVIKLTHLSTEKKLSRKAQEAYLALQLERKFSKDDILEMYLNIVYFGRGAYGIEAAAKVYFDKSASELSIDEAASLAAILKSPTKYAPHLHPDNNLERRNLVLDLMADYEMLTGTEANNLKKKPLTVAEDRPEKYNYGYYIDTVLDEACEKLGVSMDELYSGGYRIYTTLDATKQLQAEALCADPAMLPQDAPDGTQAQVAMVVMDPKTGGIQALVGGREHTTLQAFNRATQAYRSPGSCIKPIAVFAPAIDEADYTATTYVEDAPVDYGGYKPQNFTGKFLGQVTVRTALSQSLNVPAVNTLHDIGVSTGMAYAQKAGLDLEEEDKNLSMALGGLTRGVTPLAMCDAYAGIANGGMRMPAHTIARITQADGETLYAYSDAGVRYMSEDGAFLLTDILRETVESGSAKGLQEVGAPLAAKTGTVDYKGVGNRDVWTITYNPEMVVTVWMGIDTPGEACYLNEKDSGGSRPTAVCAAFLKEQYADRAAPWFDAPDGVVAVDIDKTVLERQHKVIAASATTPKEATVREFYKLGDEPTDVSDYWDPPAPPQDVHVEADSSGVPIVTFTMQKDTAYYEVFRKVSGEATSLGSLDGSKKAAALRDITAPANVPLEYYVVAVHKEKRGDGSAITGNPSHSVRFVRQNGSGVQPAID
nr:PBP1A family penicillin-binding protein [Maliibacterium massiliense]